MGLILYFLFGMSIALNFLRRKHYTHTIWWLFPIDKHLLFLFDIDNHPIISDWLKSSWASTLSSLPHGFPSQSLSRSPVAHSHIPNHNPLLRPHIAFLSLPSQWQGHHRPSKGFCRKFQNFDGINSTISENLDMTTFIYKLYFEKYLEAWLVHKLVVLLD